MEGKLDMSFDFDKKILRRGTNNAKWDSVDADVIPMWVADMDFQSPPVIINKLKEILDHGVFGYPNQESAGQESIAKWVKEYHGWQISPEEVVLIPGVVTGFNLASHAITSPGDKVLSITPAYKPFLDVADNVKLLNQEFPLTIEKDGHYSIDLAAFEAIISQGTKILLFCNPHNPTGRVFKKDELEAISKICIKYNVVICSDEIHSDLVYKNHKHIPIASLSEAASRNTITLMAPSKTFNVAGLKVAAAIIRDKDLRDRFLAGRQGLVGWVNTFGNAAFVAAYQAGGPWLNELLHYLEDNLEFLYNFVNKELPGVRMTKPEATYLAWLDCREAKIDGNPKDFFHEVAKVELVDGKWFGEVGEGFVRLNFGCPRQQLEDALLRMKNSLNK